MPNKSSSAECNSIWTFRADTQKRTYSLTIEYCSELSPKEHEEVHCLLNEHAQRWIVGRGLDPANCPVKIKYNGRLTPGQSICECEREREQVDVPQPLVARAQHTQVPE